MDSHNKIADTVIMLCAVEWEHVQQAAHIFARHFAQTGSHVIWVEPPPHRFPRLNRADLSAVIRRIFRKTNEKKITQEASDSIEILGTISFPERGLFRYLNRLFILPLLRRKISKKTQGVSLIQIWKPLDAYAYLMDNLDANLCIYSCIENYTAQYRIPRHIDAVEGQIAKGCDATFAKTELTLEKMNRVAKRVYFRDTGVSLELFGHFHPKETTRVHTVGFFGVISDRLDFSLIEDIASAGINMVLLGPSKRLPWPQNRLPANITILPPVPHSQVPTLIKNWDAILLPYKINALNKGSRFMKFYECLATGKPIYATPVPFLTEYRDVVTIIENSQQAIAAMDNPADYGRIANSRRRIELASKHDWSSVIERERSIYRTLFAGKGKLQKDQHRL